MEYKSWLTDLRTINQQENSLISLRNGIWSVKHRKELWDHIATSIYDSHLDQIVEIATEVLSEIDPQFDLETDKRYAAKVYGKALKHSEKIRKGLSETLALIGADPEKLVNCSANKKEFSASKCIRKILDQADWKLWGSLSNLLPTLAEAAPIAFLECVENTLHATPCQFDELFNQEGDGAFGRTYVSGLLWALEALAWSDIHLVRVNVILAELATHDPGGKWTNRPINSLKTILTPWLPQTLADADKRLASIKAINRDYPNIAWKIIVSMLPNQHQTSHGTNKPKWGNYVPEEFKVSVSDKEYWDEVSRYIDLAIDIAESDTHKLKELIKQLNHLGDSYERVLSILKSDVILNLSETEKTPIWKDLVQLIQKHKRFPEANWTLKGNVLAKLEEVAELLAPKDKLLAYEQLFATNEWGLLNVSNVGDMEAKRAQLSQTRVNAVGEIYILGGISLIYRFLDQVQVPDKVGFSLAGFDVNTIEENLLAGLISGDDEIKRKFARGFASGAFEKNGWSWVNSLNLDSWELEQRVELLRCLPFESKTIDLAKLILGSEEHQYWKNAWVNHYHTDADLIYVIDKLLEVRRVSLAIDILDYVYQERKILDINRSVKALLMVNESIESDAQMDEYHILNLIKALQENPSTPAKDLFNIEWFYVPLLNDLQGHYPVFLQKKLATEPAFFCEMMSIIYKADDNTDEDYPEPDQHQRNLAMNAWKLMDSWRTPPGQFDCHFDEESFKDWVKQVVDLSTKNGRLDISMQEMGEVFYYYPETDAALWIPQAVAEVLDGNNAEHVRNGYVQAAYNSRGAHWVDPEAKPELELAEKWQNRADIAERQGYPRFAANLRTLAESYKREAKRIISEHSNRNQVDNND
jgi:phage gpG-like protein